MTRQSTRQARALSLNRPAAISQPARIPPMAAALISRQMAGRSMLPRESTELYVCLSPLLWSESFRGLLDG